MKMKARRKRRVVSFLLSMAVVLAAVPFVGFTSAAGPFVAEAAGDFEYRILPDDTVQITGYTGSDASVVIPSEIDGKKVTEIGYQAFRNHATITDMTIPQGVTTVAESAFSGCSQLRNVSLPDSLEYIGIGAFSRCSSLAKINIPRNVSTIGFDGRVFYGCNSLAEITVDDGNANYLDIDGVLYYRTGNETMALWEYPAGRTAASYTIPDGTVSAANGAFNGCDYLEHVICPDGMSGLGESVFSDCTSLKTVALSEDLKVVLGWLFSGCVSLESLTIPEGVTEIWSGAFTGCTALKTVEIPASVTGIASDAFDGCDHLTIVAPEGSYAIKFAKQQGIKYQEIASGGAGPELVPPDGQSDVATVRGVTVGSTGGQVIEQLRSNGSISAAATVRVLDSSGTELPQDAALGTGMVIEISDGGSAWKSAPVRYVVVIGGDITGDGEISASDARMVLLSATEGAELSGAQSVAADINEDMNISATDARSILQMITET